MTKRLFILLLILFITVLSNPVFAEEKTNITNNFLIDSFLNGYHSPELFKLPNGINEFDLLYVDGIYHLFYDDKTQTRHRSASTIAGLQTAVDDLALAGNYPTVLYENGIWHLWVWDNFTKVTKYYTANKASGPYIFISNCPANLGGDWHVRKNPADNKYYVTYKDTATLKAGVAYASNPNGPWTNLGYIFDDIGRAYWHSGEEADPAILFYEGHVYVTFAGWDGVSPNENQRVAIVEIDPKTMKAKYPAVVLVEPLEAWQQVNGMKKVFNPVFLDDGNSERIFYSHNVSAAGIPAGWGYVEVGKPISTRTNRDVVRLDTQYGYDIAAGIKATVHGTAKWTPEGLETDQEIGGGYGPLAVENIDDFTLTTEFTITALPPSGEFAFIGRIGTVNSGMDPAVGIWIKSTKLYAEIHGNTSDSICNLTGSTDLVPGKRYRVSLRRVGNEVGLYLNGQLEACGTQSGSISGLEEWAVANQKGLFNPPSQQFKGVIHRFEVISSGLPLSRL